jgi:hypothetical protein
MCWSMCRYLKQCMQDGDERAVRNYSLLILSIARYQHGYRSACLRETHAVMIQSRHTPLWFSPPPNGMKVNAWHHAKLCTQDSIGSDDNKLRRIKSADDPRVVPHHMNRFPYSLYSSDCTQLGPYANSGNAGELRKSAQSTGGGRQGMHAA